MEEQNKYFTPNIESLRIGYQCEANLKMVGGLQDNWTPVTMKGVDEAVRFYHSKGVYRVAFLTNEQIEEWETKKEDDEGAFSGILEKHGIKYSFLWTTDNILSIYEKYPGDESSCIYRGDCWDINTFRYLTKLIGI